MKTKYLKVCVCLMLVCALIVGLAPIQSQAAEKFKKKVSCKLTLPEGKSYCEQTFKLTVNKKTKVRITQTGARVDSLPTLYHSDGRVVDINKAVMKEQFYDYVFTLDKGTYTFTAWVQTLDNLKTSMEFMNLSMLSDEEIGETENMKIAFKAPKAALKLESVSTTSYTLDEYTEILEGFFKW